MLGEQAAERGDFARTGITAVGERTSVRHAGRSVAVVGTLLGLALSAWMAVQSDGVHHDDDLTHLQLARWSSSYPQYLLNEWGRPGFTVLFALPAQFGWLAARLFSGLLTALTAWLAYTIARRQGITLAPLVPWLVWLQPATFTLSYTTLTETVLAFYLTLAMWLLMRRWFAASAAVMSLCLLTRHEAAIWLPLWALAMYASGTSGWLRRLRPAAPPGPALHAPWYAYALLLWAPLAQNVLSAIFLDRWPFAMFLDAKPTEEYGSGGWFAMLSRWVLAAGAGLLVLALAGGWRAARRPWGWLWIGAGLSYFLAHTIIFRFGLFASGGYHRFLVPIAPVVAVAAAEMLTWFFVALREVARRRDGPETVRAVRRAIGCIAAATFVLWIACEVEVPPWLVWARYWLRLGGVMLLSVIAVAWLLCGAGDWRVRGAGMAACPAICLWFAVHQCQIAAGVQAPHQQCGPLVLVEDQLLIREAADWLIAQGLAGRNVINGNPWVDEFLSITASAHRPRVREQLARAKPGDIVFWDRRYVGRPGEVTVESLLAIPGMVEIWQGRAHSTDGVYCRLFELRDPAASGVSSQTARP